MKLLVLLGALVGCGLAHDAMFWGAKTAPAGGLHGLVKAASEECPLLVFRVPRFSQGDFSREAGAWGTKPTIPTIRASMLQSAGYQALDMAEGPGEALEAVPSKVLYFQEAKDLAEAGKSPVIVVDGEDLRDVERRAKEVLATLSGKCFRAVLTGTESGPSEENLAKQRSKRAAATPAPSTSSPDVGLAYGNIAARAPPGSMINSTVAGCKGNALAFVNSASVLLPNGKPASNLALSSGKWTACQNLTGAKQAPKSIANLHLVFGGAKGLTLDLGFELTADDNWGLASANATYAGGAAYSLSYANLMTLYLYSVRGNSYACGQTDFIWFVGAKGSKTPGRQFAISLGNFQVEPFAGQRPAWVLGPATGFTDFVDDCVPFFTPGVWMGFVSLLILLLTLIFGLSMIASLKTMDKFDDPKGKPLNINAKE